MGWRRFLLLILVSSLFALGERVGFAQAEKEADQHAEKASDSHKQDSHAGDSHGGGAHTGGHHDETDLSHQNAGAQQEDPSEFKYDLAIWTFVVFGLLMLLLMKFAWRPIMEGLDKREQSIAVMFEETRRNADKSAELLRQHEAKMASAASEAREMITVAKREADALKDRIVAEAQSAAQRERERAVNEIQVAKNAALQEMTNRSIDLAFTLAKGVVRKQLNRDDHAQLIRETLDRFSSSN